MSVPLPARRLGQSCLAFRPRTTYWVSSSRAFTISSARSAETDGSKDTDLSNPLLDEYLEKRNPNEKPPRPSYKTGTLSDGSIFKKEYEIPGFRTGIPPAELEALKKQNAKKLRTRDLEMEKEMSAFKLDPNPAARRSYERKLVIRGLRKRREGKALHLKRTEREMTYKSQELPASLKKMTRLMRQIAGKTVEEALIQMRFSKKRVARDIVKGLQYARDEAIAARGMGLGAAVDPETQKKEDALVKAGKLRKADKTRAYLADGTKRRETDEKGTVVELRDGSKKVVSDPTEIYIDQAWASRGNHGRTPEFRARGRVNMLYNHTARANFLLKEEKTRMRISDEIKKKRANKPLWLPLPDRPVTTQRQYCLW